MAKCDMKWKQASYLNVLIKRKNIIIQFITDSFLSIPTNRSLSMSVYPA
jgi:hypothetical protein